MPGPLDPGTFIQPDHSGLAGIQHAGVHRQRVDRSDLILRHIPHWRGAVLEIGRSRDSEAETRDDDADLTRHWCVVPLQLRCIGI